MRVPKHSEQSIAAWEFLMHLEEHLLPRLAVLVLVLELHQQERGHPSGHPAGNSGY